MNTKNVFMLAVLSAVMLTGLAATTIQATPAFASKDECEKNSDNNCNEIKDRGQSITQENHCYVEDNSGRGGDTGDNSGDGGSGSGGSNSNDFSCDNSVDRPNTGNDAFNELIP
ncbi:MAG TPA: hypothetical protein VI146_08060 [Nitrososphaeraceae archaeon]